MIRFAITFSICDNNHRGQRYKISQRTLSENVCTASTPTILLPNPSTKTHTHKRARGRCIFSASWVHRNLQIQGIFHTFQKFNSQPTCTILETAMQCCLLLRILSLATYTVLMEIASTTCHLSSILIQVLLLQTSSTHVSWNGKQLLGMSDLELYAPLFYNAESTDSRQRGLKHFTSAFNNLNLKCVGLYRLDFLAY